MIDVPGFRLLEQLHDGAKTLVFRARTDDDARDVVLKLLREKRPTSAQVARFKREYAIGARLAHRAIAHPAALLQSEHGWVIVQHDTHGVSLDKLLAARTEAGGGIALDVFFDIALELCDALELIHGAAIIHKDINPSNLIWDAPQRQVQLIDFGISSELEREVPGVQSASMVEGTLAYVSPEQTGRMNRVLDYRSDYYSLGATFYELLSGSPPFASNDAMELVHCHMAQHPDWQRPAFARLPPQLLTLLQRLLEKDADRRYQSAACLRRDLLLCKRARSDGSCDALPPQDGQSGTFRITQKLYGRQNEIAELIAAFERAAVGASDMLLVAGYSGVGKSAVVHELHRALAARRGYFATGKCDQYRRNTPHTSLLEAFDDLIRQLLAEPHTALASWSEKLHAALGPNLGVITELLPNLTLIVGPLAPAPLLAPLESRNRLNLAIGQLLDVFCRPEHPLVIFLDDLQWADRSTLNMIEHILRTASARSLLLVGAYRDNEVDTAHPLSALRERLRAADVTLRTLSVPALSLPDVTSLIADTLGATPQACMALAQLCHAKTSGNPFFLNQFLHRLHKSDLLRFDFLLGQWEWDMQQLELAAFTDNVLELMARTMDTLPAATRDLLQLAASMGNRFELVALAGISALTARETQTILWPALEADLIRPVDARYKYLDEDDAGGIAYRFLHDRVQQAAYLLADDPTKERNHLLIGRMLLRDSAPQMLDELLFAITEQLNAARALIDEPHERLRLAQLNHQAGVKARAAAAYQAAHRHMEIALALLPDEAWSMHPRLMLDVQLGAAEAAYLSGQFALAEVIYPLVLAKCQETGQTVRCLSVQMAQYQLQGRFFEAIELQREGLALLDIHIPTDASTLMAQVGAALIDVETLCGERPIQTIMQARDMQSADHLAAMQLLFGMWYASYLAGQSALNAMATLLMTRLSLQYGNCDISSFGFVNYAFITTLLQGRTQAGFEFGTMAVALSDARDNLAIRGSTYFLFATFTNHWSRPLRTSDPYYDAAYGWSLQSGDFTTVGYIIAVRSTDRVIAGQYLPDLLASCERDIALLQSTGQIDMVDCTQVGALQPIKQLMGRTFGEHSYDDASFNEQRFLHDYADRPPHLAYYLHGKIRNAYLFDSPDALTLAAQLHRVEQFVPGQSKIPEASFYAALIWMRALCRTPDHADRAGFEANLVRLSEAMVAWAAQCPANFGAKSLLLQAQTCARSHDPARAQALYQQAIDVAHEHATPNLEALANELNGQMWLDLGQPRVAAAMLREALYLYQSWGALAKCAQLRHHFPHLDQTLADQHPRSRMANTTTTPFASLELAAILKSAHALSSALGLEGVVAKLIEIVRDDSGAQTVRLLLLHEQQWQLEGQASDAGVDRTPDCMIDLDASASELFPLSMLRYVARTGTEVVEDDINVSNTFGTDPYVQRAPIHSAMCMPIKRYGQVVGMLYLENRLMRAVFNTTRLGCVRMLALQATIAIDNALLYDKLERRVQQRTLKLEQANLELARALETLRTMQDELLRSAKLASLGSLVAGIAHELNTPLGNSVLVASALKASTTALAAHFSDPRPRRSVIEQTLAEMVQGAELLERNLHRSTQLVSSFKQISVDQASNERHRFDVREVLEALARSLEPMWRIGGHRLHTQFDGPIFIDSYPGPLAQVITHMATNALRHGFDERLRGNMRLRAQLLDPATLEIVFSDDGVGIAPEHLERVFDPFFTTRMGQGESGLGMHIVYNLVNGVLGGKVTLSSTLGEGTVLTLRLPVCAPVR